MFLSSAEERGVYYKGGSEAPLVVSLFISAQWKHMVDCNSSVISFYTCLSLNDLLRNKRNKDEDIVKLQGLHSKICPQT